MQHAEEDQEQHVEQFFRVLLPDPMIGWGDYLKTNCARLQFHTGALLFPLLGSLLEPVIDKSFIFSLVYVKITAGDEVPAFSASAGPQASPQAHNLPMIIKAQCLLGLCGLFSWASCDGLIILC